MRVVIAVLVLAGLVQARPQGFSSLTDSAHAQINSFESESNSVGDYNYNVESSDGQLRGEKRMVLNRGTNAEMSVVEGYYSYMAPNGQRITVGYTADDNGFHPEGEHLGSAGTRRRPPQVGIPANAVKSLQG